jgi:hypothetical protein
MRACNGRRNVAGSALDGSRAPGQFGGDPGMPGRFLPPLARAKSARPLLLAFGRVLLALEPQYHAKHLQRQPEESGE